MNKSKIVYFVPLFVVVGFGDTPLFLPNTGDRFGERFSENPFSFSGDGDDPPVAEFRRDADKRTVVSR